jgi:hypothetical protein
VRPNVVLEPAELLVHQCEYLLVSGASRPKIEWLSAFSARHERQWAHTKSLVAIAKQRLPSHEIAEELIELAVQLVCLRDFPIGLFDLLDHVDDFAQHTVEGSRGVIWHRDGHGCDGASGAPSSSNMRSSM